MTERIDGFVSFTNGANDGVDASVLADNYYARGVNISTRGGLVKTRPPWKKLLTLESGLFQRAALYRLNSADRIVYTIAGNVKAINTSDMSVEDHSVVMSPTAARCYYVKPDEFFIIQDGTSTPVILQGNVRVDSSLEQGFKVGTLMAYGHNRIFIVPRFVPDNAGVDTEEDGRPYFIASDLLFPYNKTRVFGWTENLYLNEGGAFSQPEEFGFINGLRFFRNAQTATGIGTLIVFGRDGNSSFAVNAPRSSWKDNDLSQVLFPENGTESPDSIINVNDDILYRDNKTGIRSIRFQVSSVASGTGIMSNPCLSNEVKYLFDLDLPEDLPYVSMASVNDRIYCTTGGRFNDGGFKCIVSLDSDLAHTINQLKSNAIYDGAWTGLSFLQILKAKYNDKDALYAFVKNGDGNELWVLDESSTSADNAETRTECRLYTKSMPHKIDDTVSTQREKVKALEFWFKDIVGRLDVTVYWRVDGYKLWNKMRTHTVLASESGLSQFRERIRITPVSDTVDETRERLTRIGSVFQYCIAWTGRCTLQKCKIFTESTTDPASDVESESDVRTLEADDDQVELDDFDYEI